MPLYAARRIEVSRRRSRYGAPSVFLRHGRTVDPRVAADGGRLRNRCRAGVRSRPRCIRNPGLHRGARRLRDRERGGTDSRRRARGQGPRGSAGAAPPAGLPVPAAIWRVIGRIPQRRCAYGDQSTGIRAHRASLPPFASAGHQGQPDLGPRHRDRERTGNTRRPGARLPHPSRLQRADGVRACQCKRALPADAPGANRLLVAGPIRAGAADQGHGRVRSRIRARQRRGRAFAAGGNTPLRRAIPGARRAHDHARGWAQGRRRSRTRQRR